MTVISAASAKSYFTTGSKPTQDEFGDLVDSTLGYERDTVLFTISSAVQAGKTGFLEIVSTAAVTAWSSAGAMPVVSTNSTTPRPIADRSRDRPHLFDWIPATQHAAIRAMTSIYDATSDVQAALTAATTQGYGELHTEGLLNISAKLLVRTSNFRLLGPGAGALDPTGAHSEVPGTVFNYTGAGTNAILEISSATAGNMLASIVLDGIALEGTEVATIGVNLIDIQHFHLKNVLVRAVTADGILVDQTAAVAAQAAGFGIFEDVTVFLREHTGSLNANGIRLNGDGAATPVGVTLTQFSRCRVTHQDGHGYVLDGDFCDAHLFSTCQAFRVTTDTGAGINITGTLTTGILTGTKLLNGCAFDGGIQIVAPSGITSNFLPQEGFDLSGILSFEIDTSVADTRMGAIGTGRHLVRGRSYGFRAGLDRLWWGLEPVESSFMRHMFNDFANNRIHMSDYTFGFNQTGTSSGAPSSLDGGGTKLTTGATSGNTLSITNAHALGASTQGVKLTSRPAVLWQIKGIDTTNMNLFFGMAEADGAPPSNGIYFEINTAVSNNWKCVTRASGSETSFDTSVALSTNVITFMIVTDPTGVTFLYKPHSAFRQSWRFLTHSTTNIPTGIQLNSFGKIRTAEAAAKEVHVLAYEHSEYLPDA